MISYFGKIIGKYLAKHYPWIRKQWCSNVCYYHFTLLFLPLVRNY